MMKINNLRFESVVTTILVIAVCLCMLGQSASAASSTNIAMIGGTQANQIANGGWLPIDIPGMSFTFIDVADVNYANLNSYDTVVINVASPSYYGGLGCDIDNLNDSQKTDIVKFVGDGKKLIIYDSECDEQDYSWLPYPFETSNPGAYGSTGNTLTIVENNTLSHADSTNAFYIDAVTLGTDTDAVGDMNVMTTYDPNWCLDMSGTNVQQVTGPVHTYAKYPAGTDMGLIIYNGLDMDYSARYYGTGGTGSDILHKIWFQELQQSFNPSNLPCGHTVVGITLTPDGVTNIVGSSHTVTATLEDLLGNPRAGTPVDFMVISGPNAGASASGVYTDGSGEATFTYTSNGITGTDVIEASFVDCSGIPCSGTTITSNQVTKIWEERNGDIPEFPTIALPIAAIIGLAFFFQRRK